MFKRSLSRTHRSKGIRVRQVLQMFLLLGVCFWLIYQVKHSHDKKKEFDEKDEKPSVKTPIRGELIKFGRKDLPQIEEVTSKGKHVEEEENETGGEEEKNKHEEEEREEEENKHEVKEQEEEENKQEGEEQEEEENKSEETEDEERGDGDDEIDENDQEKSDGEADHNEEFIDEEKAREEDDKGSDRNESEAKEGQVETSLEDQDHDRGSQNIHEAREEHYKGDDASSAVTHDTQSIISETEKLTSENSTGLSDMNILEQENKFNNTQAIDGDRENSVRKVVEGEMAKNVTSFDVITIEKKGNDSSPNTMDSPVANSTMTTQSYDHSDAINNPKLVSMEANNISAGGSTEGNNSTETGTGTFGSSQQNGTLTISDLPHPQNKMINLSSVQTLEMEQTSNSSTVAESNQSDVSGNSTIPIKIEKADAGAGESSTSFSNTELAVSEKITTEAEDGSMSSNSKENTDANEREKSDSESESGGLDESSINASRDGTLDVDQDNLIDSESHTDLDEKEVRTDLDTLPDIRTEGDNNEDTAAE